MLLQQGDVLILSIDEIPSNAKKRDGKLVLAEGEATGHAHRILDCKAAALSDLAEKVFLEVFSETDLTHEEHGTIAIPPGTYQVSIVREYDHFAEESREVAD